MKLKDEIDIQAPPERVWHALMDLESATHYVPYLLHIERLDAAGQPLTVPDEAEIAVGSQVRMVLGAGEGQAATLEAVVTKVEAPHHLAVRGEHEGFGVTAEIDWRLVTQSDSTGAVAATRLRQTVALSFRSMIARIGAKAMMGRAERELAEGLMRFKELVERSE